LDAAAPVSLDPRVDSVPTMETETREIRDTDLEQLLAEAEREEPFLVAPRPRERFEPKEEIDEQILAGLVHPY
jgi:hypothetical protein